jgi:hypothetical protein
MQTSFLYTTLLCLLAGGITQAQTGQPPIAQAIAAGGGTSTALPGYTIDFTIGETVILTAGTDPACTEGIQQPIIETAKIDSNLLNVSWYIKVYPNPFHDQLTVHAYMDHAGELDFRLFDILGRPILNGRYSLNQGYNDEFINTGSLSRGTYVLYMFDAVHLKYQTVKLLKE